MSEEWCLMCFGNTAAFRFAAACANVFFVEVALERGVAQDVPWALVAHNWQQGDACCS